jgi:hypothetical protein
MREDRASTCNVGERCCGKRAESEGEEAHFLALPSERSRGQRLKRVQPGAKRPSMTLRSRIAKQGDQRRTFASGLAEHEAETRQ